MSVEGLPMEFDGNVTRQHIRSFSDIPDIFSMEIPPIEYVVPALGISRNSITQWTAPDGDGKTYLALAMGVAVARGAEFLGMKCQKSPVLYIDLENPAHTVQDRLRLLSNEEHVPDLRVWGIWNEHQPPQAGSELLLTIAKETKPVIIVDPFRYFHTAEENDSTEMAGVMQYLRACAAYGCAVIILHHPAKSEGSTGRGSSVIRGACDLALLHSLDKESQVITLKVDKNRNGESRTINIKADFEGGKFEITDSPYITRRNDELKKLQRIIAAEPGITQNAICKSAGMKKTRVLKLLAEGRGTSWGTENGTHGAICYWPLESSCSQRGNNDLQGIAKIPPRPVPAVPAFGNKDLEGQGNKTPHRAETHLFPCSPFLEGNREQVADRGKNSTSCPNCKGFAVYAQANGQHTCMTCEEVW